MFDVVVRAVCFVAGHERSEIVGRRHEVVNARGREDDGGDEEQDRQRPHLDLGHRGSVTVRSRETHQGCPEASRGAPELRIGTRLGRAGTGIMALWLRCGCVEQGDSSFVDVVIVDYDPQWPRLFATVETRIRQALGDSARCVVPLDRPRPPVSPAVANGVVYIGTLNGKVFALA